jgi:hypothetical protein
MESVLGISMAEKQTPALKRGGMVQTEELSPYFVSVATATEALVALEGMV